QEHGILEFNSIIDEDKGNDDEKHGNSNVKYTSQDSEINTLHMYNTNMESILMNFVGQLKGMLENLIEKFSIAITNNLKGNGNINNMNACNKFNSSELSVRNNSPSNINKSDNSILINDSILIKNNDTLNDSILITKKSQKNTKESQPPEEEWNKLDPRKQKAINTKYMFAAKKNKKFEKDVEDIIDVEPNGCIFKDHTYSVPNKELECEKKRKNTFHLGFYNFLDNEDWNSLEEGCMLTNFVVDFTIFGCIKEYSKEPATLEFVFIDSLHDHTGKAHYETFISNCRKNSDETKWKFVQILERKKQDDGVSCGVFVILYALSFLK
ncbi:hypothetical protein FF38_00388, partial [Lucilia cuprina]